MLRIPSVNWPSHLTCESVCVRVCASCICASVCLCVVSLSPAPATPTAGVGQMTSTLPGMCMRNKHHDLSTHHRYTVMRTRDQIASLLLTITNMCSSVTRIQTHSHLFSLPPAVSRVHFCMHVSVCRCSENKNKQKKRNTTTHTHTGSSATPPSPTERNFGISATSSAAYADVC
jgi:hypothetical protein